MPDRKTCQRCKDDIPDWERAFELRKSTAAYICQRCMTALVNLWHEEHKVSELIVDEEHKVSELIVQTSLGARVKDNPSQRG